MIKELTFTRVYDAPRELVFRAWTDPEHVAKWWGPKGFTNRLRAWEAKPGGRIDLDMIAADGNGHPMGGEIREVVAPERFVFTSSAFEDENGDPQIVNLNTVTLEDIGGGRTRMTVLSQVMHASEMIKAGPLQGMEQGWSESLDRLSDLVARL